MGAITLQFVTSRDPELWGHPHVLRGWCSHVDSVMDDGRLLGARSDGGVQIRPPNYEKFSGVEPVVLAAPYYKERAYSGFLKAQIGKPYDKPAIVAFAFNRDWRSPDAWFCDELVVTREKPPTDTGVEQWQGDQAWSTTSITPGCARPPS
jgi:hypothetical protein